MPPEYPEAGDAPDDVDVASDISDFTDQSPLLTLFGTESKVRIMHVLLAAPEPLNPARIVERAGISSTKTWYNVKDDLLSTGLVEQTDSAGNSPLYALVEGDPRVEALHKIYDLTAEEIRE